VFNLEGKAALVTGASGGIGGAIARALHKAGAKVVLAGTRRPALDGLASELGDRAFVVAADLADAAAGDSLVKAAEEAAGQVDILVNNAGLTRDQLALRMKDEDWQKVIDVDLTAGFRLARAVMRGMMKRRWGRIIGITSVVGVTGNPGQANYAAAKAGRIHCHGDDRSVDAGTARANRDIGADGSRRDAGRSGRRRSLLGKRRGTVRHRPHLACEWWDGHDLATIPWRPQGRALLANGHELCYVTAPSARSQVRRTGRPGNLPGVGSRNPIHKRVYSSR
jgi:hypothetical protein